MHARRALPVVFATLVLAAAPAPAQVVLTGGGTYTQNFDNPPTAMPTSGFINWAQNSTIPGWYAVRSGTSAATTLTAGDGSNFPPGDLYSFGIGTSSDRALGDVGSPNIAAGSFAWGVVFRNDGALPLSITNISFAGEQWWRSATETRQFVNFTWAQSNSPITEAAFLATNINGDGSFTVFTSLNFSSQSFMGGAAGQNGNITRDLKSADFTAGTGAQLDPGEYMAFRWYDSDHLNTDHGLAIDDLTITFTPVPEPGTVLAAAAVGLGLTGVVRRVRRGEGIVVR